MRISSFVRHLPLLFAITSPALLLAQFQKPTDEELKMTADPKAPGAAAVYLNVEEVANDPIHFQTVYVRIKVLQEKGKELATVHLPYWHGNFKIEDIKARTIHSDGTIIPLIGKPEDLLLSKTALGKGDQMQINSKVFTLPSVEVGSILEYRYDLRYDDDHVSSPTWEIQRPYFVHQARYTFTPFKAFLPGGTTSMYITDAHGDPVNALIWYKVLPAGVDMKADVAGVFRLEVTDIPAAPDEEFMPPLDGLLYQVKFYYKSAHDSAEYWVYEAKRWSKEVDHFAEPSRSIKEAVAGIIAPGDSELDKAKKLYKAVQALDNTDYSRKKTDAELKQLKLKVARRAEDTWAQKSGSSQDIALLYLAMLRAAGLNANDMKVVDRSQRVFAIGYLDFDQLDDDIVLLNSAGKEIPLDPGEKMCPFQIVRWTHSGTTGIAQADHVRNLGITPEQAYTDNKTTRTGELTLDEHGAIAGQLTFVTQGQQAIDWRQAALKNDQDELKKQFDHSLESYVPEGVEAHVDHFVGLDDPEAKLVTIVNVHGNLGAATSKRLLLPGFFFQTRGSHPFVNEEKRLEPVDMRYGEQVTDQIVYHLPANMSVEGAPLDTKISWQGHAIFATKTASAPGQITIARILARGFSSAKPEEYQDLRGFYQKVAAADQAQLVLVKTAPAQKGN
ncbi:MAG: DUF3857 and transglutaminase domain-containing protein [Terracidiphilus sp.]|jgi:hypothetical protein